MIQKRWLCALMLVACGGSKEEAQEPLPPIDTAPGAAEPAPMEPDPTSAPTAQSDSGAAVPATEPVKATPVTAVAELKSVKDDSAMGTLTFELGEGKVSINGQFSGLKPGDHAFYIHEKGDCGGKGKKAGGHLNPTKAKHGPPESAERHAGDFGNLTVDESGNATFAMTTDSLTMETDRPDSVLGRAVIIHANKDDKKGTGGPAVACGVINLRE